MIHKNMTIEDLAELMEVGFTKVPKETDKKIDDLEMTVQRGFEETATKGELADFREAVNERFDAIDQRLDRIENILIAGHDRRIERLEDTVRQLVTAVKLK